MYVVLIKTHAKSLPRVSVLGTLSSRFSQADYVYLVKKLNQQLKRLSELEIRQCFLLRKMVFLDLFCAILAEELHIIQKKIRWALLERKSQFC